MLASNMFSLLESLHGSLGIYYVCKMIASRSLGFVYLSSEQALPILSKLVEKICQALFFNFEKSVTPNQISFIFLQVRMICNSE